MWLSIYEVRKMRKTIPILLLLIQFSCSKPAPKPEGLILKVQYQPESKYLISTIRGTETVITYSGQQIAMQKLKSMHIQNPTISKVRTKTDTELVTTERLKDNKIPVSITYKKTESLDGKGEIPEGTIIFGEIKANQLPVFNSIASSLLDFDQKTQLMQMVKSTFDQFNFPEQRLKIGDQFSMDRPVSIPMEGSEIQTVITTSYKLLSITNGMAQFEINQKYQMTPQMMDNSFTGKGIGKGQLFYDIANNLIINYSIKTEVEMNKKLDYFEFDLKTINEISQTTQIIKQ
jgi:hypothetical protein